MNGLPDSCYFVAILENGDVIHERDTAWSSISKYKTVKYFGMKKEVLASKLPIRHLEIHHEGLEVLMDIPPGCQVYCAFRSQMSLTATHKKLLGRCVGIIRNGEVIEERFLNGSEQQVLGMRK